MLTVVKNVPNSGMAYVGIVYDGGCAVGGQPSVLKRIVSGSGLFHDGRIDGNQLCRLNGAVLVYGDTEIQEIMGRDFQGDAQILSPSRYILSPIDGKEISASSAFALFERSVNDMLGQPVRWNALLHSTVNKAKEMDGFENRVLASGSTKAAESLSNALRSALDTDIKVESLRDWCSSSAQTQRTGRANDSTIVVVGMSERLPSTTDVDGLQQDLRGGLDVHIGQNSNTRSKTGQKEVDIENALFGCSVEESDLLDPQLPITTAYEALEMSGFVPNRTPSTQLDRVGTFYSQSSDDWRELGIMDTKADFNPVGPRAFTPGRVSHYFNFGGPSHSVDTACSSSLAAIHLACKSLQSRECDTAVVGGLDVSNAPDISANFSLNQDLDKMGMGVNGPMKKWGPMASGYSHVYGFGSIVMKRLQDAKADNDNILGAILGSATNHSGDAVSATRPHAGNQLHLNESLLRSAGIDVSEVSHIETHGTRTPSRNHTDIGSGTESLEPKNPTWQERLPLQLSPTSSSIGYIETAAGVTALINILLKLRKHQISDHPSTETVVNPRGVSFSETSKPPVGSGPALAFLNRVSVARGNTALLLQSKVERSAPLEADPRSSHTVAISANSISSLKRNIKLLASYLEENPNTSLPSLAYTTTARRVHHRYRMAISTSSIYELQGALRTGLGPGKIISPRISPPKIAFIFTGQGAYYPRIGRQLYELSSQFCADVNYLNSLAERQDLPSFLSVVDGGIEEGSHLPPLIQQLATTCIQMALVRLWQSWGVKPSMVIGQSLGEYAALNAAGVISVDHTIHLVGQRGRILQSRCRAGTHGMVAVKSSVAAIQQVADGRHFEVECLNSAKDTIIGGKREEMDELVQLLTESGQKCKKLNLPFAFHSAQVEPVLDPFETVADGVVFEPPKIPVISSLLGEVVNRSGVFDAKYCRRHTREPVDFLGAVQAAQREDMLDADTVCIEIGPHPVCSPLIASTLGSANIMAASLRKSEDAWQTICASLGVLHCNGVEIDWNEVQRDYASSHQLLDLPAHNFEIEDYEVDYPIPSSGSSTSSLDSCSSDYEEGHSSRDSLSSYDTTLSGEGLEMK